jgi:hypothetical protein
MAASPRRRRDAGKGPFVFRSLGLHAFAVRRVFEDYFTASRYRDRRYAFFCLPVAKIVCQGLDITAAIIAKLRWKELRRGGGALPICD